MVEIASALKDQQHITSIVEAVTLDLAALPTDPLLIRITDTAPAETLFYLAGQYGVLGWAGWRLATTEQQRRDLIKMAIKLQRTKGTPASIKNAIATLGFGDVEIRTAIGLFADGTYDADGSVTASGGNWASFRVQVNVPPGVTISPDAANQVRELINEYKPAHTALIDVTWGITLTDQLNGTDVLDTGDALFLDSMTGTFYADGQYSADGTIEAGAPNDTLELRILPA